MRSLIGTEGKYHLILFHQLYGALKCLLTYFSTKNKHAYFMHLFSSQIHIYMDLLTALHCHDL